MPKSEMGPNTGLGGQKSDLVPTQFSLSLSSLYFRLLSAYSSLDVELETSNPPKTPLCFNYPN